MTKCWIFFAEVTWSVLEVGFHHKNHNEIAHFYLEYSIFNLAFLRKSLAPSKTTVNYNKRQLPQIFTIWASWVYRNRFELCSFKRHRKIVKACTMDHGTWKVWWKIQAYLMLPFSCVFLLLPAAVCAVMAVRISSFCGIIIVVPTSLGKSSASSSLDSSPPSSSSRKILASIIVILLPPPLPLPRPMLGRLSTLT